MQLSDDPRRFFRNAQFIHAFVINVVINGVIAGLILRGHDTIPLWGDASMAPDLLATGILLPLFMTVIVSRIIAKQVESGKLPPLPSELIAANGLHRKSSMVRGLVLAAFGTLCGSLPLVVMLDLAQAQPLSYEAFVGFKAFWAGTMAALLSPPLAWWALCAASEVTPAPGPASPA